MQSIVLWRFDTRDHDINEQLKPPDSVDCFEICCVPLLFPLLGLHQAIHTLMYKKNKLPMLTIIPPAIADFFKNEVMMLAECMNQAHFLLHSSLHPLHRCQNPPNRKKKDPKRVLSSPIMSSSCVFAAKFYVPIQGSQQRAPEHLSGSSQRRD